MSQEQDDRWKASDVPPADSSGKSPGKPPVKPADETEVPFGANAMRLTAWQWSAVVLLVLPVILFTPLVWSQFEPLPATPDYRIPYALSDDYWIYSRIAASSADEQRIGIVGDSVIWGEYVRPQKTLSAHLNRQAGAAAFANTEVGAARFANLGLNGAHPLALSGLVASYATSLRGGRVIVHCNLLWMSSPERDLSSDKEQSFNHPHLVPQFVPDIPCYKASISDRMGNVFDRNLPYRGWAQHLRIAYLGGQNLPDWTLEHPYADPLRGSEQSRLDDSQKLRHKAVPWFEQGMVPQDLPWIGLGASLQWPAFRETVERLQSRGNRVFVLVGPLNEHMLTPASRQRYRALRGEVERWLGDHEIAFTAPAALPSEEYADASHPLSPGYARLANGLLEALEFRQWLKGS